MGPRELAKQQKRKRARAREKEFTELGCEYPRWSSLYLRAIRATERAYENATRARIRRSVMITHTHVYMAPHPLGNCIDRRVINYRYGDDQLRISVTIIASAHARHDRTYLQQRKNISTK